MYFKLNIIGMLVLLQIFIINYEIIIATNETRRIMRGQIAEPFPFMVYILKTNQSKVKYIGWLCGGSIVHPQYILTSAACLEDVEHMYVIAGYDTYVNSNQVEVDPCTKRYKKKIIQICVPREYELVHEKKEKWSVLDIGLAKVDTPYDFNDEDYVKYCSYKPIQAEMNFDPEGERPGTYSTVLGWGHTDKYREEQDTTDYNNEKLLKVKVIIRDKFNCQHFYTEISEAIEKFMICSHGSRHGFCQNDHGGPIVNDYNVILGVQSVFAVEEGTFKCKPPFLYTSTNLFQVFIQCVLYGENGNLTRRCNTKPHEIGYSIDIKQISWKEHPEGKATN